MPAVYQFKLQDHLDHVERDIGDKVYAYNEDICTRCGAAYHVFVNGAVNKRANLFCPCCGGLQLGEED